MATMRHEEAFTADEYHHMAQVWASSRRGTVPSSSTARSSSCRRYGSRHTRLRRRSVANRRADQRGRGTTAIVQPQGSVRLDLFYEPEPDLVLLRPQTDFYASRHREPQATSSSSSRLPTPRSPYDRDIKAPLYAMAGIAEYWLADLTTNVVWRHSSPGRGMYQRIEECHRGQSIAPLQLPTCVVPVDVFLIE